MTLNLLKLSILSLVLFVVNPFSFVEPKALQFSVFTKTLQNLRGVHKGQKATGEGELRSYLQHFGYLTNGDSSNNNFDDNVDAALKHYQEFNHLRATGVVDDETIKRMSLPRCGMPDIVTQPNGLLVAPNNYSFFPGAPKWRKFALTYGHTSSVTLSSNFLSAVKGAKLRALQKWAAVSRFTFTERVPPADIVYGFHRGDHGDGSPFDGQYGVLARAFAPQNGRCHYDADEPWNFNGQNIDYETVALHELGHILGLGHSTVQGAVMEAAYTGVRRNLAQDDINGIRALYG